MVSQTFLSKPFFPPCKVFKFSFFSKVALETIKRLFWQPDIIVCNDWQMSYLPVLLKKFYSKDEYYKNIKTLMILHDINDSRLTTNSPYNYVGLNYSEDKVDALEESIKCSDHLLIIDDLKGSMKKKFSKHKNLVSVSKKTKTHFIEAGDTPDWKKISSKVETLLRKI